MDGDFKLVVLFCLVGIIPVQGYIFRVKSEASNKGVCLTDEQTSAIAPIQPLNSALLKSSENGWLASLNERIDEFECFPFGKCKNWNLTNATSHYSSTHGKGFLNHMDKTRDTRLWNYLPEFKTDGNEELFSPAIRFKSNLSSLALSILAEEAEILLTNDKQWQGKPGIFLSLEATGEVWMSVCSKVFTKKSICSQKHKLSESSKHVLNIGAKWFTMKFTSNGRGVCWFQLNNDSPTSINGTDKCRDFNFTTFRSKNKPGLFKFYKDVKLILKNKPFTFKSPSIDLLKPRTIAFTFQTRPKINYSVVVDGHAQNSTTTSVRKNELLFIDYLQIKNSSSAISNLTISFTPDAEIYLLRVSTVSKGHSATYMNGQLSACQIMSTGEVTSNIQNDAVAASLPDDITLEDICDKLNAPNCRGVEACSPDGCFCFSGHTRSPLDGKCTQGCDGNHYGPNCIYEYNGTCKAENFDVHTGFPNCEKEKILETPASSGNDSYGIVLLLSTTIICLLQSLVTIYGLHLYYKLK